MNSVLESLVHNKNKEMLQIFFSTVSILSLLVLSRLIFFYNTSVETLTGRKETNHSTVKNLNISGCFL